MTKNPISQVSGWIAHKTSAENPIAWPGTALSGPLRNAESNAFAAQVGTECEYQSISARNASRLSKNPLSTVTGTHGIASFRLSPARQRPGVNDRIVPKASLHIDLQVSVSAAFSY